MLTNLRLKPNGRAGAEATNETQRRIRVPHVQQCYQWDCGLACVSMVLKYFDIPTDKVYTSDLDSLQCGENVWTIDLAYLLGRYMIPHHYCTITLGVDKNYSKQAYYSRIYDKESVRVNKAFEEAEANGISVEKKSMTVDDIVDHLKTGNIAVALIDWTAMQCVWCDNLKKTCFCCLDLCTGYEGHYIVLCGYDLNKSYIYYKNPNIAEELCCSRFSNFDKARKSFGTDEDVLFVFKKTKESQNVTESPKSQPKNTESEKSDVLE